LINGVIPSNTHLYVIKFLTGKTLLEVVKTRKTKMVSVKILEEDRQIIEEIAKRYDITMSDVIRMALREFLERRG